jgi:hypothetical protein
MKRGTAIVLLTSVAAFGFDIESAFADRGQNPVPNRSLTEIPGVIGEPTLDKPPPTRIAKIFGGLDHQPTESEVLDSERAVGINLSAAQRNRGDAMLKEIYRHLEGEMPAGASQLGARATTRALQPDFEVTTPVGPASVSIRETPPNMTFAEFEQEVGVGMRSAVPTSQQTTPVTTPFPTCRIVWHVYPDFIRGYSRLVVNAFDGSRPISDAQHIIDNTAPASTVVYAVRTLTERLAAKVNQRNQEVLAQR